MSDLTRDEQLVRSSKARAAIIGFLNSHEAETPITQDTMLSVVEPLGLTSTELSRMLWRMATDGLILKHPVVHERFKVGYTSIGAPDLSAEPPKRRYTRKVTAKRPTADGAPIDVRVNEREGIITIRYAGMVLSFSKE